MNSVVHFEIMADDPRRAMAFYREVFGWRFEDYAEYTGSPYWGVITRPEGEPGINGGLLVRSGKPAAAGAATNAFVCTVQVEDFDLTAANILKAGGSIQLPKYALSGMAWQGYFADTEGNLFGLHQADTQAQ